MLSPQPALLTSASDLRSFSSKNASLSLPFWRLCPASPSVPSSSGPVRGREMSRFALTALEFFLWLVLTLVLLDQIVRPLQTLANVVGALREEDYSFRARGAAPNDALGELALEINSLADILTEQRIQTIEATALLRRVVDEIDAPLFTFDPDHILRLVNAAGERLLQQPAARLLGQTATELELNACFEARNETLVALPYSTPNARWMVRRSSFRQNGVPHTLIVLSDVSRALREEERSAWQRLIRVLGHELNNSLAPIISIAGSLASRLPLPELPEAQNADFQRGLNIIESRTAALHRFLQSYRRLAQMPSPNAAAGRVAASAGAGRGARDASERRNRAGTGYSSDDRSRPHRADADQPGPQCGRRRAGAGAIPPSRLSICGAKGLHAMGTARP